MNTKFNEMKMMIKISVQPWDVSMYTPYIMYGIRTIYIDCAYGYLNAYIRCGER